MITIASTDKVLSNTVTLQYAAQGFAGLDEAFWLDLWFLAQLKA
jgi:hypothetical protein